MSNDKVDEIFKTPWMFVNMLSAATTSPLIRNQRDFKSIADFLFFSHVSTKSVQTAAILKKALFAMLKNYAWTNWKFDLGHLVATFMNLGM